MKRIFFALALALSAGCAMAVPAMKGVWKTLRLADGTEVRAQLQGDEFGHWWTAADGRVFTETDADGIYRPAVADSVKAAAAARRQAANSGRTARLAARRQAGRKIAFQGSRRGLIILANFADTVFKNDRALYERIANEKGFSHVAGFTESVRDYFLAQSDGQFDLSFDVVGPVNLPNRMRYYGTNNDAGNDRYLGKMVKTACEMADTLKLDNGSKVNFADYDWDGDGKVDQVFVLYAGQGEAAGGAPETIWPQEGKLSGQFSDEKPFELDGVTIDTYAVSCELNAAKTIDGIGTICHEFSHCFGLPDMYDTTSNTYYGTSIWDTMCWGNYLNDSFTPAGYTAYERMACGWKQPIELKNDTLVTDMKALSEGGDTYIIYNEGHPDEYYLLENRQLTGCDAALYGAGLLVTHVDYSAEVWASNKVNATSRQRCVVVPADNSMNHNGPGSVIGNREDIANDLYPATGNTTLSNTSVPAATLNNANTDGSMLLNKIITGIRQNDDGTIAFRFVNGTTDGISTLHTATAAQGEIYTLDGRHAGTDASRLAKGIYVRDGKKVVLP